MKPREGTWIVLAYMAIVILFGALAFAHSAYAATENFELTYNNTATSTTLGFNSANNIFSYSFPFVGSSCDSVPDWTVSRVELKEISRSTGSGSITFTARVGFVDSSGANTANTDAGTYVWAGSDFSTYDFAHDFSVPVNLYDFCVTNLGVVTHGFVYVGYHRGSGTGGFSVPASLRLGFTPDYFAPFVHAGSYSSSHSTLQPSLVAFMSKEVPDPPEGGVSLDTAPIAEEINKFMTMVAVSFTIIVFFMTARFILYLWNPRH